MPRKTPPTASNDEEPSATLERHKQKLEKQKAQKQKRRKGQNNNRTTEDAVETLNAIFGGSSGSLSEAKAKQKKQAKKKQAQKNSFTADESPVTNTGSCNFSYMRKEYFKQFFLTYGYLGAIYIDDDELRQAITARFKKDGLNTLNFPIIRETVLYAAPFFSLDLDMLCNLFPYKLPDRNKLKYQPKDDEFNGIIGDKSDGFWYVSPPLLRYSSKKKFNREQTYNALPASVRILTQQRLSVKQPNLRTKKESRRNLRHLYTERDIDAMEIEYVDENASDSDSDKATNDLKSAEAKAKAEETYKQLVNTTITNTHENSLDQSDKETVSEYRHRIINATRNPKSDLYAGDFNLELYYAHFIQPNGQSFNNMAIDNTSLQRPSLLAISETKDKTGNENKRNNENKDSNEDINSDEDISINTIGLFANENTQLTQDSDFNMPHTVNLSSKSDKNTTWLEPRSKGYTIDLNDTVKKTAQSNDTQYVERTDWPYQRFKEVKKNLILHDNTDEMENFYFNDPTIKSIKSESLLANGPGFTGKVGLVGCLGSRVKDSKERGKRKLTQIPLKIAKRLHYHLSRHDITFLLGNHFHDDGFPWYGDPEKIQNHSHKLFKRNFINTFGLLNCFATLGNQDLYIHKDNAPDFSNPAITGFKARQPLKCTYSPTYNPYLAWNMPYRYYALFSKIADFFIIDSNSFIFDEEQQHYLVNRYAARAEINVPKVLVLHHPFLSASQNLGNPKACYKHLKAFCVSPNDSLDGEMGELTKLAISDLRYINNQGKGRTLKFDIILCSHDHLMTIDEIAMADGTMKQVISGGGGAGLINAKDKHKLNNERPYYGFNAQFERISQLVKKRAVKYHFTPAQIKAAIKKQQQKYSQSRYASCNRVEYGYHIIDFKKKRIQMYNVKGMKLADIPFGSHPNLNADPDADIISGFMADIDIDKDNQLSGIVNFNIRQENSLPPDVSVPLGNFDANTREQWDRTQIAAFQPTRNELLWQLITRLSPTDYNTFKELCPDIEFNNIDSDLAKIDQEKLKVIEMALTKAQGVKFIFNMIHKYDTIQQRENQQSNRNTRPNNRNRDRNTNALLIQPNDATGYAPNFNDNDYIDSDNEYDNEDELKMSMRPRPSGKQIEEEEDDDDNF
ncbi:hypothetical protein [uncultured Shewanella sp.]|uniref:hypothetical protein n=1 Tax=uncultured Shewanella sp. TaxID=173975 RepID=UPI002618A51C|nr:hypothetical protein [uncultured Shewanella sp.]